MTTTKKCRWPWGRLVAGTVGAVILFFAVASLYSSRKHQRECDVARVAEPIRLRVDLSKPGAYAGDFRQTCTFACSGYLEIMPESPPSSEKEAVALIEGLRGHFSIVGPDGMVAYERGFGSAGFVAVPVDKDHWAPALERGSFSFDKGVYQMNLVVDHGAPALAGVPHSLVARYGLCGAEYAPVQILSLIGIVGCIIAGIILLGVALITIGERYLPAESNPVKET